MYNVSIVGRCGADPEMRATTSGKPMATVSLAVDQFSGGKKTALWQRITAFGGQAEVLVKYCRKGHTVAITGRMTERKWLDGEGREKLSRDVIVSDLTLLPNGGKVENAENPEAPADEPEIPGDMP